MTFYDLSITYQDIYRTLLGLIHVRNIELNGMMAIETIQKLSMTFYDLSIIRYDLLGPSQDLLGLIYVRHIKLNRMMSIGTVKKFFQDIYMTFYDLSRTD